MSRGRWRKRCPGCGAHTAEVVAVGQPSGAEDFQVAEVVAQDFLGTGHGAACRARRAWTVLLLLLLHHGLARGRVLRLLLLLLLLRQGARGCCCGLKAEVVLERGGCSSLLHHTGEKSIKSLEVNSVQVVRKNGNVMRVPTPAAGRCGVGAGGCRDACRPRGLASRPSQLPAVSQLRGPVDRGIAPGLAARLLGARPGGSKDARRPIWLIGNMTARSFSSVVFDLLSKKWLEDEATI